MNPIATLAAPLGDPADDGTDRVVAEQRADRLPDGSSTAKVAVSDRFMRSGAAKRWALADSPVSLRAAAAMDTEIGAADGTRPIRSSLPARIAVDTESGGFQVNCIFVCVFGQREYVDMLFVLLRSIEMYGKLDSNTEILVYTSSPFAEAIKKSDVMSEKVRFATNDTLNDIDESCKARLDLFDLSEVQRYDKILYLDTDIVVTGSVNRVFDAVVDDVLYVLEEGSIDAPEDYWGASLFGAEVDNYPDKSGRCHSVVATNPLSEGVAGWRGGC